MVKTGDHGEMLRSYTHVHRGSVSKFRLLDVFKREELGKTKGRPNGTKSFLYFRPWKNKME
jgi:hypothetical protein